MATKTLALVVTKGGDVAAQVFGTEVKGRTIYRWTGKWGAGCGSLADIATAIRASMASRRGWSIKSGHALLAGG